MPIFGTNSTDASGYTKAQPKDSIRETLSTNEKKRHVFCDNNINISEYSSNMVAVSSPAIIDTINEKLFPRNTEVLELDCRNLMNFPDFSQLKNLKRLVIKGLNHSAKIKITKLPPQLTELVITYGNLFDFPHISAFQDLNYLEIRDATLFKIDGAKLSNNIKKLVLKCPNLRGTLDLSALQNLQDVQIKSFAFEGNGGNRVLNVLMPSHMNLVPKNHTWYSYEGILLAPQ